MLRHLGVNRATWTWAPHRDPGRLSPAVDRILAALDVMYSGAPATGSRPPLGRWAGAPELLTSAPCLPHLVVSWPPSSSRPRHLATLLLKATQATAARMYAATQVVHPGTPGPGRMHGLYLRSEEWASRDP